MYYNFNIFYYAYKLRYSQIEPKDHSKIADRKNLGTYLFFRTTIIELNISQLASWLLGGWRWYKTCHGVEYFNFGEEPLNVITFQ